MATLRFAFRFASLCTQSGTQWGRFGGEGVGVKKKETCGTSRQPDCVWPVAPPKTIQNPWPVAGAKPFQPRSGPVYAKHLKVVVVVVVVVVIVVVVVVVVMESMESMESMEPMEPMESMGSMESMESMEPMESMESMESMDSMESMESMGSMESKEPMEPMESMVSLVAVASFRFLCFTQEQSPGPLVKWAYWSPRKKHRHTVSEIRSMNISRTLYG